jgi:surface protein
MFFNDSAFNQDLSGWSTGSVTSMLFMFQGCTIFDQDLGGWNVTSLSGVGGANMLNGTTLSTSNYDSLLIGWESQAVNDSVSFHGGNAKYSGAPFPAEAARAALIADHSWAITDGGPV